MTDNTHNFNNRYTFSTIPSREKYSWPNGSKLAVYFALNVEAFEFGLNPGADFTSMPKAPYHRGYAYRDYGNRVGIWRLLNLFNEFNFPCAILVNGSVYEKCPEILVPWRDRGDEFVGHGRTNSERQAEMSYEEEKSMFLDVNKIYLDNEGTIPKGWLGPFISQSPKTPELLIDNGYKYMLDWWFDDQPQWFRTDNGKILSIPYPSMELNDIPAFINRGIDDDAFTRMMIDTFDEMYEESAKQGWAQINCFSLHTFLMGQPHRIRQLRKVFKHISSYHKDIWICHPGNISDYMYQK
ncbi:MAG: polysaccharide deacetylase [Rhodospirillaceae bacterium]|nr:polysaccharide deacetylase [Rhodospirillaceae bacterium]|tara:strand:+ start:10045 stop:10932 length:888 start_codon:yes stop_codon:yes gene_type:complete